MSRSAIRRNRSCDRAAPGPRVPATPRSPKAIAMPGSLIPRKIDRQLRGELEIATAMAREEILEAHVTHLLELIQITHGQISPRRVLEIYLRLHLVDPETGRKIASKALAMLGQRRESAGPSQFQPARSDTDDWDPPPSLLSRIRKRLRGRTNPELRMKVELHTGRAQVAFLRVHVDCALRFVRILAPEMPIAAVVALYAEVIGLKRSVAETVYSLTLDRLSAPPLAWPEPRTGHEPASLPAARSAEPAVRIITAPR